jgi:integration host factor subunit beta
VLIENWCQFISGSLSPIPMTRSELVAAINIKFPWMGQADIKVAVDEILGAIGAALSAGKRIEVRGFGTFTWGVRPERVGRNPKTGAPVQIPRRRVPYFKPHKTLLCRLDPQGPRSKSQT